MISNRTDRRGDLIINCQTNSVLLFSLKAGVGPSIVILDVYFVSRVDFNFSAAFEADSRRFRLHSSFSKKV